jgi:acyl carrier protein
MPSPESEDRLRKLVAEQLGVDESLVVSTASFTKDLNADSLDLVELIMSIEEEFGIEIPDEEAEKIETVEHALKYLDDHAEQE